MIGRPIPNQGNATVRTLAQQIFQKGNRPLGITCLSRLNQALLSIKIDRSIVSLLAPVVGDWNLNPVSRFAPDVSTQVPPQQVAFILKQNDQLARDDLTSMCL